LKWRYYGDYGRNRYTSKFMDIAVKGCIKNFIGAIPEENKMAAFLKAESFKQIGSTIMQCITPISIYAHSRR